MLIKFYVILGVIEMCSGITTQVLNCIEPWLLSWFILSSWGCLRFYRMIQSWLSPTYGLYLFNIVTSNTSLRFEIYMFTLLRFVECVLDCVIYRDSHTMAHPMWSWVFKKTRWICAHSHASTNNDTALTLMTSGYVKTRRIPSRNGES